MSVNTVRRFAISLHRTPDPVDQHLDLFIENGEGLATFQFRSLADLSAEVGLEVSIRRLADHRRRYLSYQGSISGDRGSVELQDQGTCLVLEASPDKFVVQLQGKQIEGTFVLVPALLSNPDPTTPSDWVLTRQETPR